MTGGMKGSVKGLHRALPVATGERALRTCEPMGVGSPPAASGPSSRRLLTFTEG